MSELSSLNTSVLFTNWTKEDFVCSWGGKPYTFRAGSSEQIGVGDYEHNLGLAKHFAKHLVDRELNKRNVPTDHFSRAEFEQNCFVEYSAVSDVPAHEVTVDKESGLVKTVEEIGREDVKTGKVTKKSKKKVEVEEEVEQVVEKPKKKKKDEVNEDFVE